MTDIFKAEWLRYRLWILFYAMAHVLLLAFFMRLTDPGQQPLSVYRMIGACYGLTGILLGLHQFGTWRRPNQWLNLLHRPVAPPRIALGLLGGGALSLAIAVVLPLCIALAAQAWGTARVVDARHAMLPMAALLTAYCGYLAGAYGMLADRRYSACGAVFLLWILLADASGAGFLAVQLLACAWLLCLVLAVFRPDLGAPPRSLPATLLTALPLQMGVYALIVLLGFMAEIAWIMLGSHPLNTSPPLKGGAVETDRMSGRDRLLAGLASSSLPDTALWREQVALSEVHTVGRQLRGVPMPGEMSNTVPMAFDDEEAGVRWTFSHRRMRYEGMRMADGAAVGELGIGAGNAPFGPIPTPAGVLPGIGKGDIALMAGNTLYQYLSATRRIVPRLQLAAGERLLGTTPLAGGLVAIGDRALYVFDGRHLVDSDTPVMARQRIAIPGSSGDLERAEMIALVNGYLVSFTFTRHASELVGVPPYQTMLWVDDAGKVVPVATRALHADFPAFYRYRTWWASPVMSTLKDAATGLFGHPGPYETYATPAIPGSMRTLAAALLLCCLAAGAWLCSRRDLSWLARIAWTAACAVVGLPAVVSLALIVPRAERFAGVPAPAAHA